MQMNASHVKDKLRPYYVEAFERSPTLRTLYLLAAGRMRRDTDFVVTGYESSWAAYETRLDSCRSVEEWLTIPGFDDKSRTQVFDGKVRHGSQDTNSYWMERAFEQIDARFPEASSITEYGSGVGRNVLRAKVRYPKFRCYGYELAGPGVAIAMKAAARFGVEVEYAKLDYVLDPPARYVHPTTDLALTIFSLEQIPYASALAVSHMLDHANLGSIHVEPVLEHYPKSYRGMLARVYSAQVDYLRNFDGAVRSLGLAEVHHELLATSHNPLIFPSIYTLLK